jgi:hypothetical protein
LGRVLYYSGSCYYNKRLRQSAYKEKKFILALIAEVSFHGQQASLLLVLLHRSTSQREQNPSLHRQGAKNQEKRKELESHYLTQSQDTNDQTSFTTPHLLKARPSPPTATRTRDQAFNTSASEGEAR